MHPRLVEVSLVILCLECCRGDWKITQAITDQFRCQEPQRRSLRIVELLKLNCQDDTVPAHVIIKRCDDTTGTCMNQRATCTAIETRKSEFYFLWRKYGETDWKNGNGSIVEDVKCGCNNTIQYECT
ncbi:hypothetical protein Trydic_g16040 [Trypoxylus dichotomus]